MSNILEAIALQSEVTKLQASIIDELFVLLMQHLTPEEVEQLPVVAKIGEVAHIHSILETD